MNNKTIVSVCVTTYYHKEYIKQALDSIINQEFDQPYEICVSDDCSLDGTVEILKDYAKKYSFIKLNLNQENVGLTKNMFLSRKMATGDYLVMLSGDDYYIDNHKLQKQYDFLKNHPDYLGVATTIEARVDNETIARGMYPSRKYRSKDFTLKMFIKGKGFPLNGIMYKNVLKNDSLLPLFSSMPRISEYIDDVTDSIFLLQTGKIYVMEDCCTVYRIRGKNSNDKNFNSQNKGLLSYKKHIEMLNNLDIFFNGQLDLFYRYRDIVKSFYLKSFFIKKHKEFKTIYFTIPAKYRKRALLLRSIMLAIAFLPKHILIRIKR